MDGPPPPPEAEIIPVEFVSSLPGEEEGATAIRDADAIVATVAVLSCSSKGPWLMNATGEGELTRLYLHQECEDATVRQTAILQVRLKPEDADGYRAMSVYQFDEDKRGFEFVANAEIRGIIPPD